MAGARSGRNAANKANICIHIYINLQPPKLKFMSMNIMIAQSSCCCFGDGFCVFFANETNANNNNIAEFSEEDSYMLTKIDKCFSVLFESSCSFE